MSAPVDYGASAVERLRVRLVLLDSREHPDNVRADAADMVVALRAALDAAERERDEAHKQGYCEGYEDGEKAADANGYARGVRDAAERGRRFGNFYITKSDANAIHAIILALLPDATKETHDE